MNFILGKNGGGRSIVVVRLADKNLALEKILKFSKFNLKVRLG